MFSTFSLYLNQTIDREEIIRTFTAYHYRSCDQVSQEGDSSHRGGIIDVFAVTFENPIRIELLSNRIHSLRSFDIISGLTLENHTSVIILPRYVFQDGRIRKTYTGYGDALPIAHFVDIAVNDLVVHVTHGIGRYLGIEKIQQEKRYLDHMVIEFADQDKLYVPLADLHLVNKYIGFEGRAPKLSKLGSKAWQRIKLRTKKGIFSLASEMIRIQAARSSLKGFSFSADHQWQKQLEESFPYEETADQTKSINEVKRDMELPRPMDRLICGDVGYGKTEVALRAAFKAVMNNKQVVLLVPTTILAEQHYYTFCQRLKDFPINIQMLSRFKSAAEQKKIIAQITGGVVDIVIGTHRLVSEDIQFKDLGLVIIDEEQRFGVQHKERLKRLRLLVDVLTLTATPIPRTLYMSLMGARDMSIINTPPFGRVPIQTEIAEYDEEIIKKNILRELERKGQCFFVHNRVKDIEKVSKRISSLLPQARVGCAHGQMHERELEEVMLEFMQGEIDVLVATTIVESGIDIPNANTLIVNRADRFGLADLYQLRGRVGRFKYRAYALFLVPRGFAWTEDAKRRLRAIATHTELGAGFKIAMEDLQIRGAGNLLGEEQHGFIMAVGFDLYCRLLRETVEELKINEK